MRWCQGARTLDYVVINLNPR